jgi:hypothetical protein
VEESLKRHFQTRVAIRSASRGGRIEISFASRDELSRIMDLLNP